MKKGDFVEIKTSYGDFLGRLMPSKKDVLMLKLKNGYNIGINKKDIREEIVLRQHKEVKKTEKKELKEKKGLKKISILLTGGTISSAVDYNTGGVKAKFSSEELISMFPELNNMANIKSRLIQNMWSDDLRFKHFEVIARAIEKEVKEKVDGVIIGIGTDNLAVASAALSFIVEESNIPIILVGAQRSSDRGSSDAGMNLICATHFIIDTDFKGVAICMHESMSDDDCLILPACKTVKLHTSRRDAFKAINVEAIAKVNYNGSVEYLAGYNIKGDKLIIKPKMEEKVGLLKIHVNMRAKQFDFFKGYKGLVLEGTGLGHMPLDVIDSYTKEHAKIRKSLKNLIKSGCVIVMTSSCLYGRVNMNVYSKGLDLIKEGVIPGEDMLANTAFLKLSWLLANYKKDKVKDMIREDLRGEVSERILE